MRAVQERRRSALCPLGSLAALPLLRVVVAGALSSAVHSPLLMLLAALQRRSARVLGHVTASSQIMRQHLHRRNHRNIPSCTSRDVCWSGMCKSRSSTDLIGGDQALCARCSTRMRCFTEPPGGIASERPGLRLRATLDKRKEMWKNTEEPYSTLHLTETVARLSLTDLRLYYFYWQIPNIYQKVGNCFAHACAATRSPRHFPSSTLGAFFPFFSSCSLSSFLFLFAFCFHVGFHPAAQPDGTFAPQGACSAGMAAAMGFGARSSQPLPSLLPNGSFPQSAHPSLSLSRSLAPAAPQRWESAGLLMISPILLLFSWLTRFLPFFPWTDERWHKWHCGPEPPNGWPQCRQRRRP